MLGYCYYSYVPSWGDDITVEKYIQISFLQAQVKSAGTMVMKSELWF